MMQLSSCCLVWFVIEGRVLLVLCPLVTWCLSLVLHCVHVSVRWGWTYSLAIVRQKKLPRPEANETLCVCVRYSCINNFLNFDVELLVPTSPQTMSILYPADSRRHIMRSVNVGWAFLECSFTEREFVCELSGHIVNNKSNHGLSIAFETEL